MPSRRSTGIALLSCLVLGACGGAPPQQTSRDPLESGDLEGAAAALEQRRRQQPNSPEVRLALGKAHYRLARDALDREGDEERYLSELERSISEFLSAMELDPRNYEPHLYLAAIDMYRGDILSTLRGLNNAKKLAPQGFSYANIAELYVYKDDLRTAQSWNELSLTRGATQGHYEFNQMLISWREGDIRRARYLFDSLRTLNPEHIDTINMAKLPRTPRSFEEFAGYCCESPACGPYMVEPCGELGFGIGERGISEDSRLKELRLEMKKRRRMKSVYEQRKQLDIKVGDVEEPTE